MSLCLVCNQDCPPLTRITRWGTERRFCSSRCIKTNYRLTHPERDRNSKQKYAQSNPEKRRNSTEKWRKANMEYYTQYASLRTRHMSHAKPKWLNETEELSILKIYELAKLQGNEVDHIIPIKNKRVCGLHVPWNLQILSRKDNASKSNKFDEDIIAKLTKKEPA